MIHLDAFQEAFGIPDGNLIHGVGGSGVSLNNEIGSFYEGPLPADTVIRKNTFTDTFFDSVNPGHLRISITLLAHGAEDAPKFLAPL